MRHILKDVGNAPRIQKLLGRAMAGYFTFVRRTSRLRRDPPNFDDVIHRHAPAIIAMWHGQHFMMPFAAPEGLDVRVLISRHRDGEINAIAAERLGLGLVRASGGHTPADSLRKGGARGFRELLRALRAGATVALTADVPKRAKITGEGIVLLARHSGRPILPVAFATSRRITLDSWDKAALNLPFSRAGLVIGDPIIVPPDAEDTDHWREKVTEGLNRTTDRAYGLAEGRDG